MRVCLVYDCLFPWTKGGAERWYRVLADELVRAGHAVTYLTRQQWGPDDAPDIPGVRVVVVSPGGISTTRAVPAAATPPSRSPGGSPPTCCVTAAATTWSTSARCR